MKPVWRRQSTARSGSKSGWNAKGFKHIGGAAFGGNAAVAVLGDFGSGGGGYQGCGGGDVKGALAVASGTAGVDELVALFLGQRNRSGQVAHGLDEAGQFFGRGSAVGEGGEQGGDVGVADFSFEDFAEGGVSLLIGQGCVFFDHVFEQEMGA